MKLSTTYKIYKVMKPVINFIFEWWPYAALVTAIGLLIYICETL